MKQISATHSRERTIEFHGFNDEYVMSQQEKGISVEMDNRHEIKRINSRL